MNVRLLPLLLVSFIAFSQENIVDPVESNEISIKG